MCPYYNHARDDHQDTGTCLACERKEQRCPGPASSFITIYVAALPDLTPVCMPGVTTSAYAAMRAAEAVGGDPRAGHWLLFDPVARCILPDEEIIIDYHNRTLQLRWKE